MIVAIAYAISEQFVLATNTEGFQFSDVNWGVVVTATLAIVLRFFNDKRVTP